MPPDLPVGLARGYTTALDQTDRQVSGIPLQWLLLSTPMGLFTPPNMSEKSEMHKRNIRSKQNE
jgi:hypothetical protein